jgi:lactate permease
MPPVVARASPYHAIFNLNWFAASGTSCMIATLLSAICLRMSPRRFILTLLSVARTLLLPTVTVTSVLAIAFLMNYCGATATLGLAFSATGVLFPFFSSLLGWLGVFLTGSDTSANALFGGLQVVTAGRLGLDPVLMAATNSVGGVMGKMISLQTIAVAAAATGMSVADQSKLFRFTLKHSILLASVVGGLALLYVYAFHLHWI